MGQLLQKTLKSLANDDIATTVRKIKNYCDDRYFYAIEITVSDTLVTVYVDKIKDVKMTNDIDRCVMQIIDHE